MTDPFSVAQGAIAKWVGARIAAGLDTALRQRQLRQGRPASDQQAELAAVMKAAVEQTAGELFPGQERLQGNFRKTLLRGKQRDWPLVNGTGLDDVVSDLYAWILDNDPRSGDGKGAASPAAHPYLKVLSRCVIAQFKFRAMNNGVRNSVLYPRWDDFRTTELATHLQAAAAAMAPARAFRNDFHEPVGTVVQGQQVIVNAGTPALPVWPYRFGTMPPLAAARQERAVDQRLTAALSGVGTAVVCQILAGMGGVGKTQIAVAFAQQLWESGGLDLLLWVNAAGRNEITAAFAHAGAELCGADPSDSDRAASAFLAWLDRPEAPRWLIVLDDLTDPGDLAGLWPPETGRGQTIITTRRRDAALDGDRRTRIDVDLFSTDEAEHYLHQRLGADSGLLDGAADLADDLGRLPLALAQAAAYILDQPGLTCDDYRHLLADRTVTLAELSPDVFPDGYARPVAAAWSLSIELADAYEPKGLATQLLQVASLLDPAGISVELFTTESVRNYSTATLADLANQSSASARSPREVNTVLGRLHRLSLIDFDGRDIYIHSLIQRCVRDQLIPAHRDDIAYAAADALEEIWPHPETDLAASASLRSNTAQLCSHTEAAFCSPDVHTVLFLAGNSLGNTGQVAEAAAYFEQLLSVCEGVLGSDHPDALSTRNFIAAWRGRTGDAAGAVAALEALLIDRLRVFGPDDLSTLNTRHNLAVWRGQAGDAAGAAVAFADLLADRLRTPGSEPADILAARHDLAHWKGRAGDIAGATAAFREVLADCLEILGPGDPRTLMTRDNLASLQGKAGDAAGAVRSYEELLADRIRVLGPDHPETLATRSHLASWHGKGGDVIEAVIQHEELLADRMRVLGPDHPDTVSTQHNLAYWKGQAGDATAAAANYAAMLEDCLRVFGPDHPHTLETRGNLAVWRGESGDALGAAEACEALLYEFNRIMGPDHPETLTTRGNLAHWRGEAGDAAGAVAAFESLLEDMLRVLGPDHPDTLIVRNNLAFRRGETGDAAGAAASFQAILKDRLRVLGRV